MNLMGIRKMGEMGLKMALSNLLPPLPLRHVTRAFLRESSAENAVLRAKTVFRLKKERLAGDNRNRKRGAQFLA